MVLIGFGTTPTSETMEPANILHIPTLGSGWCDKDVVILHACFGLFERCVEEEKLLSGHTDWEYDDQHREVHRQLTALYEWWQARKERDASGKVDDLNRAQYDEDNEKLIELIRLRQWLWT